MGRQMVPVATQGSNSLCWPDPGNSVLDTFRFCGAVVYDNCVSKKRNRVYIRYNDRVL